MAIYNPMQPLGSERRPALWLKLVVINIVLFVLQKFADMWAPGVIEQWFGLSGGAVASGQLWQFFTYMFLHGSLLHLLVNMLTLMFAGREIEALLGPRHLLGLYLGGGLLGGILQLAFTGGSAVLVGASAAVFALLIAFTTIMPETEIMLLLFFILPVRLKAKFLALGLVVLSLFFILTGTGGNIGHFAHLGGALFGWLYAHRLGYGNPLWVQRYFWEKWERKDRQATMSPEEYISAEIDPILDKISREGIHSLTRAERKTLERGREKIDRRTRGI